MSESAPELDPDNSNYAHCQLVDILPIPADKFLDWFLAVPLEDYMLGSMIVPVITGTRPLSEKPYGTAGTSRIIDFRDKSECRECIISTDFPNSYFYQPYGFTSPLRFLSDHAKSTMHCEAVDKDTTRIVWDYAFHARNKIALQLIRIFVKVDWMRYMKGAIDTLKVQLAEKKMAA